MNHTQSEQFYAVLSSIPVGKVVTYGRLAELAGKPRGARWVGQMLKRLPADTRLPWFRVINAQGKISFPTNSDSANLQVSLLQAEGVEVNKNNRIDLKKYGIR